MAKHILTAIALSLLSTTAWTQETRLAHPFYVNGDYSAVRYSDDLVSVRDKTHSIRGGYAITPYLDVEGGYSQMTASEAGIDIDVDVISLRALGRLGSEDREQGIFLVGGLGYHRFDTTVSFSGSSASDDDWYPSALIGGEIHSRRVLVRASYEYFDVDGGDARALSLGVGYRF